MLTQSENFGPFDVICTSGGYLSLLDMRSGEAARVLTMIAEIVRSVDDHPRYVNRLLDDRNWRGHLIAIAAVLVSAETARQVSLLWRCFDRGSWVAPQLAVSLYCSDPGFAAEAKRRILARCPIDDADGFFGGQTRDVSAKNLASLLRVMTYVPGDTRWTASELDGHDVRELLRADRDGAGPIVERWFDAARARFRELGRDLKAAA